MSVTLSYSSIGHEKIKKVTLDLHIDSQIVKVLFDVEIQSSDPHEIDSRVRAATWDILRELSKLDPEKLPIRKPQS